MKIDIGQLEFINPLLRKLAIEVETIFDVEFTITSLYRINDNGVHGQLPLRGLDLRCRNDELGKNIVEYVNSTYIYDRSRPNLACCMYHDTGLGKHIHLQVHPNTEVL